jgi:hypothetical protein
MPDLKLLLAAQLTKYAIRASSIYNERVLMVTEFLGIGGAWILHDWCKLTDYIELTEDFLIGHSAYYRRRGKSTKSILSNHGSLRFEN